MHPCFVNHRVFPTADNRQMSEVRSPPAPVRKDAIHHASLPGNRGRSVRSSFAMDLFGRPL